MRAVCGGRVEHVEDSVTCCVVRGACQKSETEHDICTTKKQSPLQNLNDKKKVRENGAFTACAAGISLLETMTDAAEIAARMATIMLSTARSSFDELQNARKCGQNLYILAESISWGRSVVNPYKCGETPLVGNLTLKNTRNNNFSFRAFLREKHEANHSIIQTSQEKGR